MNPNEALKKELVALERRYWQAIKDGDAETAASLSADPCMVVGAQGVSELARKALPKLMQNATHELHDFSLDDIRIRRVSDDVVALAYTVEEKLTVDGAKVGLKAFDSSIWVRHGDRWLCAVHTESPAGDPFGRH